MFWEKLLLTAISYMNYTVHFSAVVDDGSLIGSGTFIWHFSHIMAGCIIGENCIIGQNVMISKSVVIGNRVKVQNNVSIYDGVTCEDDVFLGPSMVFTNVINPRSAIDRKHELKSTIVRRGATIGANATIICGNEIGEYAMIGASAVVTKPVPSFALIIGNPGRIAGWVSESGNKLKFNSKGLATCEENGDLYQMKNNRVNKIKV